MTDRELAKELVTKVFNVDLKGEVGRMARWGVSKEDKRDIVNRVHRLITTVRQETAQSLTQKTPDIWDFLSFVNHPEDYEVSVNRDRSFNVRPARLMMQPYPTYKAGWFCKRVLGLFGFAGITAPWRAVYIHPDYMGQEWLIRHERQHIKQIDRMGAFKWTILIAWYYVYYGYKYSPLEIEARHAESDTECQ